MNVGRATGTDASTDGGVPAGRRTRRGLLGMVGAVAIGLLAASAAFACTVGLHGTLVVAPPAGEAGETIELFTTLKQSPGRPPQETDGSGNQQDYPVVMDPTPVSRGVSTEPSQCFGADEHDYPDGANPWDMHGDGDDVLVGAMYYGSEEAFSQAGTSDPSNNPTDQEGHLYGHGTFDVPSPGEEGYSWGPGTYEVCTQPEEEENWDHFTIIAPSTP